MGIIKAIFGFLAIAAVVVGLFQVAPPMLANYSFQDDLKNVALMDGSVRKVSATVSQQTWTNALNPADGQVLGSDW